MRRGALLVVFVAGGIGCGDAVAPAPGTDSPVVDAVRIVVAADTMSPAEAATFRALPAGKDGSPLDVSVSWTSSNPAVATVDGDGVVNALTTGSATITAAAGSRTDARTLAVVRTWKSIAAAEDAICGITLDDRAWCWGQNYAGQLGDGTTTDHAVPALVAGDHRWARLSLNFHSACGVTLDTQVLCWGSYDKAYFNNIVTTPSPIPQAPSLVTAEAGFWAGCGLAAGGDAWCWGRDDFGGLGDGSVGGVKHFAVPVAGGLTWRVVDPTGEDLTCGLTTGGVPYCWGIGYLTPTVGQSSVPVPVSGSHVFASLATFFNGACALDGAGQAWCWGQAEFASAGGTPSTGVYEPVPVGEGLRFTELSAARYTFCGVTAAGGAYCWGDNSSLAVGVGQKECSRMCPAPTPVSGGHRFISISTGARMTCGLTEGGAAWCWGTGRLGDGHTLASARPVRVGHPVGAPVNGP